MAGIGPGIGGLFQGFAQGLVTGTQLSQKQEQIELERRTQDRSDLITLTEIISKAETMDPTARKTLIGGYIKYMEKSNGFELDPTLKAGLLAGDADTYRKTAAFVAQKVADNPQMGLKEAYQFIAASDNPMRATKLLKEFMDFREKVTGTNIAIARDVRDEKKLPLEIKQMETGVKRTEVDIERGQMELKFAVAKLPYADRLAAADVTALETRVKLLQEEMKTAPLTRQKLAVEISRMIEDLDLHKKLAPMQVEHLAAQVQTAVAQALIATKTVPAQIDKIQSEAQLATAQATASKQMKEALDLYRTGKPEDKAAADKVMAALGKAGFAKHDPKNRLLGSYYEQIDAAVTKGNFPEAQALLAKAASLGLLSVDDIKAQVLSQYINAASTGSPALGGIRGAAQDLGLLPKTETTGGVIKEPIRFITADGDALVVNPGHHTVLAGRDGSWLLHHKYTDSKGKEREALIPVPGSAFTKTPMSTGAPESESVAEAARLRRALGEGKTTLDTIQVLRSLVVDGGKTGLWAKMTGTAGEFIDFAKTTLGQGPTRDRLDKMLEEARSAVQDSAKLSKPEKADLMDRLARDKGAREVLETALAIKMAGAFVAGEKDGISRQEIDRWRSAFSTQGWNLRGMEGVLSRLDTARALIQSRMDVSQGMLTNKGGVTYTPKEELDKKALPYQRPDGKFDVRDR